MAVKDLRDTWMAKRADVRALDQRVANALRPFLPDQPDSRAPHSVSDLCEDLVWAWQAERWFLVCCACALLTELLLASPSGSLLQKAPFRLPGDVQGAGDLLTALRHACFHPALLQPPDTAPIEGLAGLLDHQGFPGLAARLRSNHAVLRSPALAHLALRLLNRVGRRLLQASG